MSLLIDERNETCQRVKLGEVIMTQYTFYINGEYTIHQAIISYQRIRVTYIAFRAKEATKSKIDPYYLFFRDGIWYLRGYYDPDKALRTFAFDRILSLDPLNEYFVPQRVSPEDELAGAFGAFVDEKPVDVILRFGEYSKPLVLRKKWHRSQQVQEQKDWWTEVRFRVNGLQEIQNWIYGWIPHVEVVAPKELRDTLCRNLAEAMTLHGK